MLDEVVERINRMDGQRARRAAGIMEMGAQDVVPQIGPRPQDVVDAQTSVDTTCTWAILSTRFGTPTGHYGSGTEKEFKDALKKWRAAGKPWILLYFDAGPN